MCNDFSGYVTQSHQVIWKRGVSSHDQLYSMFVDNYPELKEGTKRAVKFEITPDAGYLHPEKSWTFRIDESDTPEWFVASHESEAMRAHKQWKKEVYDLINLKEARSPINPLTIKHKPTKKDIELLKEWDSVRASVRASVGASVWASVRAYQGSMFNIWDGSYKFHPAVDLWKRGLVASFDGKLWRLHSGKKAEIVYTWNPSEKE